MSVHFGYMIQGGRQFPYGVGFRSGMVQFRLRRNWNAAFALRIGVFSSIPSQLTNSLEGPPEVQECTLLLAIQLLLHVIHQNIVAWELDPSSTLSSI